MEIYIYIHRDKHVGTIYKKRVSWMFPLCIYLFSCLNLGGVASRSWIYKKRRRHYHHHHHRHLSRKFAIINVWIVSVHGRLIRQCKVLALPLRLEVCAANLTKANSVDGGISLLPPQNNNKKYKEIMVSLKISHYRNAEGRGEQGTKSPL